MLFPLQLCVQSHSEIFRLRSENKVQGSVRYPLPPRAPGFFKIKPHKLDWVGAIQVKLSVTVHKLVSLPATVQDCFVLDMRSRGKMSDPLEKCIARSVTR
jgi:hypothetical protein